MAQAGTAGPLLKTTLTQNLNICYKSALNLDEREGSSCYLVIFIKIALKLAFLPHKEVQKDTASDSYMLIQLAPLTNKLLNIV